MGERRTAGAAVAGLLESRVQGEAVRGYVEESEEVKAKRALHRAAELYVSACLADGYGPRVAERGAFLEGMAIEYAQAVAKERKKKR